MVDKKLMEILACPACKGDVKEEEGAIVCLKCSRAYPVIDDIPVMLVDEATVPGGDKNDRSE